MQSFLSPVIVTFPEKIFKEQSNRAKDSTDIVVFSLVPAVSVWVKDTNESSRKLVQWVGLLGVTRTAYDKAEENGSPVELHVDDGNGLVLSHPAPLMTLFNYMAYRIVSMGDHVFVAFIRVYQEPGFQFHLSSSTTSISGQKPNRKPLRLSTGLLCEEEPSTSSAFDFSSVNSLLSNNNKTTEIIRVMSPLKVATEHDDLASSGPESGIHSGADASPAPSDDSSKEGSPPIGEHHQKKRKSIDSIASFLFKQKQQCAAMQG